MHKTLNSIFSCFLLATSSLANASITITDPTTNHIDLRTNCGSLENCATDLSELLDWLWNQRNPTAADPVLVDIGVGTFYTNPDTGLNGDFCSGKGHATFRGSGRDNTVITGISPTAVISVISCTNLAFQDLTLNMQDALYGFYWEGGGSSTYSNVHLTGTHWTWYDTSGSCSSKHYFTSSIISSTGGGKHVAYFSRCAETWFFGSEISVTAESNGGEVIAINNLGGEIHVYGSVIRAIALPGVQIGGRQNKPLTAVVSTGETHIHGTGIDVISTEGNNIAALIAGSGGSIHAPASSYVLKTGPGGTANRLINNGGTIMAPYQWETSATPPAISSSHGSDMVITTDNPDSQPHMLIYSDNCTSKWFDSTLNQCQL